MNAASISRILSNAGISKSKKYRGRICYLNSEGFAVTTNYKKEIVVSYYKRTESEWSESFKATQQAAYEQMKNVLMSKGYNMNTSDNGFVVTKAL